jgi:Holliday junction resolvasome RuvABC endonuclease subunit
LASFESWLDELLMNYSPDQVLLEKPFFGHRRNTYGVLQMYVAIVLASYYRWSGGEIPSENRIAAHEVKRRLKQPKGKSYEDRKRLMVRTINKRFNLRLRFKAKDPSKKLSDDDTADAIAVVWSWILVERPDWDVPQP